MEELQKHDHEHTIDILNGGNAPSSASSIANPPPPSGVPREEVRPPSTIQVSSSQTPNGSNSRVSSVGREQWTPFNCSLWFLVELIFTLSQITASIVVLSVSRHERPRAPLFAWIVGYAAGCVASLPVFYWRLLLNQNITQSSTPSLQGSSQGNSMLEVTPYVTISLTRPSVDTSTEARSNGQPVGAPNTRFSMLMSQFKRALDCFFSVWFVVGIIWIFLGHASSSEAPNLYRLCIVFLTISSIWYAMPFILCATVCCCFPCIISILRREDLNRMRGATAESINALPTYIFKLKKTSSGSSRDNLGSEGGVVFAGTERERAISGEDAVCCICLGGYVDNDELRELPCSHFFHAKCVDDWLRINAICPLCKFEVGENNGALNSNQQL